MPSVKATAGSKFVGRLRSERCHTDMRIFGRLLQDNPRLLIGLVIVCTAVFVAIFAPLLSPYDPQQAHPGDQLQPPSLKYWLGTDVTGMDIFSCLVHAPRTDLTIALTATALAIGIGLPVGVLAGYYRNLLSEAVMRLADLLQSFPVFIFRLASKPTTTMWPSSASLIRIGSRASPW